MVLSRIEAWKRAAHTRIGEQLFRKARADFEAGTFSTLQPSVRVAKALAALILATPIAMLLLGLYVVTLDFPNLITLVIGGVLTACGVYVFPWSRKLPEGGFRREDLPELFALCDEVGARIGAKPLTLIYITDDINAFYTEHRGERAMGIGLGLWVIATPQERVSVIAHEMAHMVNNDVARSGILSLALSALERWYYLFGDSEIFDHEGYLLRERDGSEMFADGIMGILRGIVGTIWSVLTRLTFADSQRSEYLADAVSTRAGGVGSATSMLSKLALIPLVDAELRGLVPSYVKDGTAFYARITKAVTNVDSAERAKLTDKMVEEHHSVDMSHPPTFQRIAFLSDLAEPDQGPITYRQEVDAEIAPHIERIGAEILRSLEIQ
ncbi:M48 family metallopeptidase [uncultured Litoreibacter sp.]|uniref:M48 family metallopeptidase n=1 Tax=uncultured Litoreibacter sp. TaxID=1392394 RepID=UPI00261D18EA|nr:M48 family metallopeptidase [uncultured Litoreibacter sp.]